MHFGDYTFIIVLALILFGPKKMPEIARQLGKVLAEFRRASNEFKYQIQEELRAMEDEERRKKFAESQALAAASDLAMSEAGVTGRADADPTILPPATGDPVSATTPFTPPQEFAHGMPQPVPAEEASEESAPPAPGSATESAEPHPPLNGAAPREPQATPPATESISHA